MNWGMEQSKHFKIFNESSLLGKSGVNGGGGPLEDIELR